MIRPCCLSLIDLDEFADFVLRSPNFFDIYIEHRIEKLVFRSSRFGRNVPRISWETPRRTVDTFYTWRIP